MCVKYKFFFVFFFALLSNVLAEGEAYIPSVLCPEL